MLSQDEVLHNSSMLRGSKPFVPSTRETGQLVYIQEGFFACVFRGLRCIADASCLGKADSRRVAQNCVVYSRNFADRRTGREKGVLARAWNCSSALTELKGRARARFEGAALVAAFVAKLLK